MYFYPLSLATVISPSQSHLPLVAPEATLRDLTEYIRKTGEFPIARGAFGDIWKCTFQVDQEPNNFVCNVLSTHWCEFDSIAGCCEILTAVCL
jgi:hypothetical protein